MFNTRREFFWGYTAQFLNVGIGIIFLPIIMHYLSTEDVGLWFVFLTLAILAQLFEMGLSTTLSRNISYVYAGAQSLSTSGLNKSDNGSLNLKLLVNLIGAARWMFRRISFLAALFLLLGGSLYLASVIPNFKDRPELYIGWLFFVVGNIYTLYYGYLNSILQGRGDITQTNKVVILSRSIYMVTGGILVVAGFRLLGLGIACFLASIGSRWLVRKYVYSLPHQNLNNLEINQEEVKKIVKTLWFNSSRLGIVAIGTFLIWRGNILIASSFLGLKEAASYGLAIQVLFLLYAIVNVPINMSIPKINSFFLQGKVDIVYKIFSSNLALSLALYILISICIYFFGDFILFKLGSSTQLPEKHILLYMMVVFFLETNHSICASLLMSSNQVPFDKSIVVSGIFIFIGSFIFAPILGILGMVMSQNLTQMVYNNWKWPFEVSKIFKVSYIVILKDGLYFLIKRSAKDNPQ